MARKTNTAVLAKIMKYGNPMKQVWIMTTLAEAAEKQANAPAPNWGPDSAVHPGAWKEAAEAIHAELKEAGY